MRFIVSGEQRSTARANHCRSKGCGATGPLALRRLIDDGPASLAPACLASGPVEPQRGGRDVYCRLPAIRRDAGQVQKTPLI